MAGVVVLHQGSFLPPQEHLAMAGDIFGSDGVRGNVASSVKRTAILLNIRSMNRTCPTTKNYLVLNVDDAKLEKALTKTGKLK